MARSPPTGPKNAILKTWPTIDARSMTTNGTSRADSFRAMRQRRLPMNRNSPYIAIAIQRTEMWTSAIDCHKTSRSNRDTRMVSRPPEISRLITARTHRDRRMFAALFIFL